MDLPSPAPTSPTRPSLSLPTANAPLRQKAEEMEAAFLAEMLAHAGLGATSEAFSGGAGETQFASFLRQEQARLIAAQGGIGLAEHIFTAMTEASRDPSA